MALILKLENRRMGQAGKRIFNEMERNESFIFIPVMVIAELGYLAERKKINTTLNDAKRYFSRNKNLTIQPITEEIIYDTFKINDIPELHDRIIAATSKNLNYELITNDPVIKSSAFINTIW